jgi:hypothetical protein
VFTVRGTIGRASGNRKDFGVTAMRVAALS